MNRARIAAVVGGVAVIAAALGAAQVLFHVATMGDRTRWPGPRVSLVELKQRVPAIVLGMGPAANNPVLDRVDLAAELWREGYLTFIVGSGGQGGDEREPEAVTITDALAAQGVPRDVLHEESRSTSTRENLRMSRAVLAAQGHVLVNGPVIIISHDYHALRIEEMARAEGYPEVLVVTTAGPRLDRRAYRLAREVFAYLRWKLLP